MKIESESNKKYKCLHCGLECEGKYCSNCGQSTATARLTARTFFSQSINGIFRVNSVFINTLWRLLLTPWVVINGYIKGHRICYTPPVVMLVLLFFFVAIIDSMFDTPETNEISLLSLYKDLGFRGILVFLISALSLNKVLFCFLMCPPIILSIRVAYRKTGSTNYSWVEYLFAATYFVCSLVAATGVLLIISLLFNVEFGIPLAIYAFILFVITLRKTFPCKSIATSVIQLLLCMLYCVISYTIYMGVFCVLLYLMLQITVG